MSPTETGDASMASPVVVVGDALLDRDLEGAVERVCPDAPVPVVDDPAAHTRPGGAGLAAALAAADGRPVTLVTALGDDAAGAEVARLLAEAGVAVVDCGLRGATPEKVRVRAGGQSLVRLDLGGGDAPVGPLPAEGVAAIGDAAAVLVSDYGRGLAAAEDVRAAVARARAGVWDPHPRGPEPVAGARLITPNLAEAERRTPEIGADDDSMATLASRARALARRWRAAGVAITLGARGALLAAGDGAPLAVPAPSADPAAGDVCGAGDCLAAAAAAALADGALASEALTGAVVRASAFVHAGAAAQALRPAGDAPARPGARQPADLAASVRRGGGTVVATGGCFDLLHAGHVRMLESARALGDCLIVCLNSDDSVRRLKGRGRPVVPAHDRAAVLEGLDCVDAVEVFDETTPEAVLDRLRPDVWAKGGDYTAAGLPEAALVASWGGEAVIVPYLPGYSTSRLLEEAQNREYHIQS